MADPIADIRARFMPLLAEAQGCLERRASQYPALVETGRMDAQAAQAELRAWRAIVADWQNIVTGQGERGASVTTTEKIAALLEGVSRYEAALPRAIANADEIVRRDCDKIRDRTFLAKAHGPAVARFLELEQSRDRLIDLALIYHSEQPAAPPWRGLWQGIDAYLTFHTNHRTPRERKAA